MDGIVAIGGGSSLDSAKAINMLINNAPPISSTMDRPGSPPRTACPSTTIPTTAGTGAEVTFIGILTDDKTNLEERRHGPATFSKLAIIDPLHMVGLPAKITAPTGADAFSHALEAVCNITMNPCPTCSAITPISRITNAAGGLRDPMNVRPARSWLMPRPSPASPSSTPAATLGHAIGHNVGTFWHVPARGRLRRALPEVARWYCRRPRRDKIKLLVEAWARPFRGSRRRRDRELIAIRELFDSVGVVGLKSLASRRMS